jgi:DNA repair protein RecN (Recombination protein N)
LRDYLSGLEANPGRLDEIENRLALLDKLKRKYGRSLEEVLAFLAEVRAQIEQVEHAGERMEELRNERECLAREYQQAAGALSALRAGAARKLEKGVETELASLAMERTTFRIKIRCGAVVGGGADRRGVSGFAEFGRRAQAAGEGGVGRRDFAHRAGAEDLYGRA